MGLLTVGCIQVPPSRSYEQDTINYEPSTGPNIEHLQGHTVTIQANQLWQSSGIHVTTGVQIKILAIGKWSLAPAFNIWSGPEGLASGPGKEVPWINSNALMGKIGAEGKPFEIGPECLVQATGDGDLFFAINDPFDWVKDNAGSMQVTIFTGGKPSTLATPISSERGSSLLPFSPTPTENLTPLRVTEVGKRTALVMGNAQYQGWSIEKSRQ